MPSRKSKAQQHRENNQLLRSVRKQIMRKRDPDPVRRRDWLEEAADDPADLPGAGPSASERVMPRGERERRRTLVVAALKELEREDGDSDGRPEEPEGERGTVVEVSTGLCRVDLGGRLVICRLRGGLSAEESGLTNPVAVGDEVLVSLDGADQGSVESVLPRRSALVRPDVFYKHLRQVIVANVDQLLVVASWREPALWLELVDRYLIAAQRNNLSSVICVNKVDLARDAGEYRRALGPYLAQGTQVLFTSAAAGLGIDELRQVLQGRTTALAGLSGVGKSSLLAAVQPGLQLRVGEVSERRHEGRHTTTQVNLYRLEAGGFVVDTPGIREFGLSGLRRGELAHFFPEIAAAAAGCRFADCSHGHEPGCAVLAAVARGSIAQSRYKSFRSIYAGLPV